MYNNRIYNFQIYNFYKSIYKSIFINLIFIIYRITKKFDQTFMYIKLLSM